MLMDTHLSSGLSLEQDVVLIFLVLIALGHVKAIIKVSPSVLRSFPLSLTATPIQLLSAFLPQVWYATEEGDPPKSEAEEKTETDVPNAIMPRTPVATPEPIILGQWLSGQACIQGGETLHFMFCPKNICREPGGASIIAFKTPHIWCMPL